MDPLAWRVLRKLYCNYMAQAKRPLKDNMIHHYGILFVKPYLSGSIYVLFCKPL